MGNGKWLNAYGVVECSQLEPFDDCFTIPYRDIALVVARVSEQPRQVSQETIKHHHEIVSTLMKKATVLPMAFGIVIPGEVLAQSMLEEAYEDLKMTFEAVRGKVELGLKVLWKKEALIAELDRDYEEIKNLRAEIEAMPPEQAYHPAIQLGQMVESVLLEKRKLFEQLIFEPLTELAVDAKLNTPIGERMVFNAAFLVEKPSEGAFDCKVNDLFELYGKLFLFKYSGPWPPYNFVNIHLRQGKLSQ